MKQSKSELAALKIEEALKVTVVKDGPIFTLTLWGSINKERGDLEKLIEPYSFFMRGNQYLFSAKRLISFAKSLKIKV